MIDESKALEVFAALSQETRLHIIRLLVRVGSNGMPAGQIGEVVGVSASNVSFHLKELERTGILTARRDARSIIYTADFTALSGLVRFLMEDCCGGRPEICVPILVDFEPCCPPKDPPLCEAMG